MFGAHGMGQDTILRNLARLDVHWDGGEMAIDRRAIPPFLLRGRRLAFDPSFGKNIALAYLPHAVCQVGRELQIQYFADVYPVKAEAVGYQSLYDLENVKPRS